MTRHEQIHTGAEKLFECKFCNKSFPHRCILNRHKQIHTDDKRYKCLLCDELFGYLKKLQKHKQVHEDNADVSVIKPKLEVARS